MSLRTYPLIVHPAYQEMVASSLVLNKPPEESPHLQAKFAVPPLKASREIGTYLGISEEAVWSVQMLGERAYRHFPLTKKSGAIRIISAPRTHLKVIQWWILDSILSAVPISDHAYGFVKGRSFIDNAEAHLGARHLLNVDVSDFFPSISAPLVAQVFQSLGYEGEVVRGLVKLTTLDNGLPQGAPTSPSLANAVFAPLDEQIVRICSGNGVKYTRYADDLTFSSQHRIPTTFIDELRDILSSIGLALNDKKTRFMGPNQKKEVTGLILGRDGVALDRSTLNAARGWFHSITVAPDAFRNELERVTGTLALIQSIGGRGSSKVLAQGTAAIQALRLAL